VMILPAMHHVFAAWGNSQASSISLRDESESYSGSSMVISGSLGLGMGVFGVDLGGFGVGGSLMTVGFITGTGSGLGAGGGGGGGGLRRTWHFLAISRMSGFFLGFVACITSSTVSSNPSSRPFLRYPGLCLNRISKLCNA
jgi:hypothetical protein